MATALQAVLLDFDHTLTDFGDHVHWADARPVLHALYSEAGVPADFLDAHVGSIGLYAAVAEQRPLPAAAHFAVQRRAAAILDELEGRAIETTAALPGAHALLESLPALDLRAAIVTSNGASVVRAILRRLALAQGIDVVIGRSEVARLKPDPEGVVAACRLLSVAPEAAVYIGDSEADMGAARDAGVRAWAVTTGHGSPAEMQTAGADAVFATLEGVLTSLSEMATMTARRA